MKRCLGIASELVSVPAELRPAVDLLLGSVIVVRDRSAARRLLSGQPSGVRAVTLQGEIFHAEGPIQAGAGESEGEQTLLGRAPPAAHRSSPGSRAWRKRSPPWMVN